MDMTDTKHLAVERKQGVELKR